MKLERLFDFGKLALDYWYLLHRFQQVEKQNKILKERIEIANDWYHIFYGNILNYQQPRFVGESLKRLILISTKLMEADIELDDIDILYINGCKIDLNDTVKEIK